MEYSRCTKCGRKRVYYRISTNDFRCRECGAEYKSGKDIIDEKRKSKETSISCNHHKYKEEGYHYELSDNETLFLCNQCNLNLAMGLMEQIAIEIFTKR